MKYKAVTIFLIFFLSTIISLAQAPIITTIKDSDSTARQYQQLTAILGAFPPEIFLLQSKLQQKKDTVIQRIKFTLGVLGGRKVVLAQTGIGKVNAAIATSILLDHFQPREVIFTGIAGGVNPLLQPGDLVVASKVAYHDFGTLTPDSLLRRATRNPATMQENPIYFICDSILIKIAIAAGQATSFEKITTAKSTRTPQLIKGIIVTGDVFVASTTATQNLRNSMQADATEMEGAAVAQTCWQQKTPFVIIRSLSDDAGNNASMDVRSFYEIAARNSASLVITLMAKMASKP